jgi:hypothetical protein
MVRFSLVTTLSLLSSVLAAPGASTSSGESHEAAEEISIQKRQGYYFQNWSEGGSNIRCGNGAGGLFTATWNSKGGFVCGKGWRGGGAGYVPALEARNVVKILIMIPTAESLTIVEHTMQLAQAISPFTGGLEIL